MGGRRLPPSPPPKYTLESPAIIVQYSQLPFNRPPINFVTFFRAPYPQPGVGVCAGGVGAGYPYYY